MNILAIDYGSKRVGLALAVSGIITTLPALPNDSRLFTGLKALIKANDVTKIFVGLSEGLFADTTKIFAEKLSAMLQLPVETIEEAVTTIEASQIFTDNHQKKKHYKSRIDSIAAAVILRRAINY